MHSKQPKPNEIAIIRLYDAPLHMVWDAWTDPVQLALWWGPRGFTITTHSRDLRPGGRWEYTMHGPDGTDYPNSTLFHEVEPGARLVYDHGAHGDKPPLFRVEVRFSQEGSRTKMDMTMRLATAEAAQETRKFIKKAGGNATWDRLGEHLQKRTSDKECFVINRTFAAPIETLYTMWTDPKHFSEWLPPVGFSMEFIRADLRAGGESFFRMSDGKQVTMYGKAHYLEMARPHRIVYRQQFCDADGKVSRHPLAPTWPAEMLTIVTLAEEGPGATRVTVYSEPSGAFTSEELATFVAGRAGMTQGWTGSFDKLEALLPV